MTEWHPDRKMLERFLEDELPEEQSRTLQRHLFTCSGCETSLIQILPSAGSRCASEESDIGYRGLVRQVLQEARQEGQHRRAILARERQEAGRLWREVRSLDLSARRERI